MAVEPPVDGRAAELVWRPSSKASSARLGAVSSPAKTAALRPRQSARTPAIARGPDQR